MGETRGAYRVLVGRPERKKLLGRSRRWWKGIVKFCLQDVWWGSLDWIDIVSGIRTDCGLQWLQQWTFRFRKILIIPCSFVDVLAFQDKPLSLDFGSSSRASITRTSIIRTFNYPKYPAKILPGLSVIPYECVILLGKGTTILRATHFHMQQHSSLQHNRCYNPKPHTTQTRYWCWQISRESTGLSQCLTLFFSSLKSKA